MGGGHALCGKTRGSGLRGSRQALNEGQLYEAIFNIILVYLTQSMKDGLSFILNIDNPYQLIITLEIKGK